MPYFNPDQYSPAAIAILGRWYADTSKHLRTVVMNPKGRTGGSKEFRQARAAVAIRQVDAVLHALNRQADTWIAEHMPAAYSKGLATADRQAREAGILRTPLKSKYAAVHGDTNLIDHRAVAILAADAAGDLRKATASMGNATKHLLRQTAQHDLTEAHINRILAGGIVEGIPLQTIRALRDAFIKVNKNATVTITDKNGDPMTFDAEYYAAMVVRNKTKAATGQARTQRMEDLGLDLVTIIGRSSKNFCTAFLGKVYSISGKSDKYPPLSSIPYEDGGFHVNCSKSTSPFIDDFATPAELEAAAPDEATSLMHGTTDRAELQRRYQDLQLRQPATQRYDRTVNSIPGKQA